jgi:hypothetical protein
MVGFMAPCWDRFSAFRDGAGLGVSHQTGWTGLVAKSIQMFASLDPQKYLE